MFTAPYSYQLSPAADNDLQAIYDSINGAFGAGHAGAYLLGLEQRLQLLCMQPYAGRQRTEIREGLRSVSHVSHIIFYRIDEAYISIVRVLHSSRDVIKYL